MTTRAQSHLKTVLEVMERELTLGEKHMTLLWGGRGKQSQGPLGPRTP